MSSPPFPGIVERRQATEAPAKRRFAVLSSRSVRRAWLAVVLGACALTVALLGAAPAGAVQFKAGASLPLGATFLGATDTPVDVKLADVDGNGDPDMVALTH